ncbi:hypothetical protein [Planctomicrobium piriforme]|uniref:Uncharacterized protein n=1 Tax=Planctomicrobium piriforme TaxID=1576369 RepID=A0A1I3FE84_9PLAN|nr:hypothetical protein [Planctomicrobium piriforme]SFI09412.1 hypothetical protein SAMN05421753_105199 [Planctomicrobium piriforme]
MAMNNLDLELLRATSGTASRVIPEKEYQSPCGLIKVDFALCSERSMDVVVEIGDTRPNAQQLVRDILLLASKEVIEIIHIPADDAELRPALCRRVISSKYPQFVTDQEYERCRQTSPAILPRVSWVNGRRKSQVISKLARHILKPAVDPKLRFNLDDKAAWEISQALYEGPSF